LSGISIVICWRAISLLLLSTANFTRFTAKFCYDFFCKGRANGWVQPRCGAQRSNVGCNPVLCRLFYLQYG
jgi:hypothetical protein